MGGREWITNRELGLGPRPCAISVVVWASAGAQHGGESGPYHHLHSKASAPHSILPELGPPISSQPNASRAVRNHSFWAFIWRVCWLYFTCFWVNIGKLITSSSKPKMARCKRTINVELKWGETNLSKMFPSVLKRALLSTHWQFLSH